MCMIFNLTMRLYGCFVVKEMESEKEGGGHLASHSRHLGRAQTLPDGISGGHVYETEWLHQPNRVCCLTHIHMRSHRPTHTRSKTQGTIAPTAFSPHLLLPNNTTIKSTVIYASSDSAGPAK